MVLSGSGGGVLSEKAYAQGKMLNHSGWNNVLPRGITPSDVDMFFDNAGSILYCEISKHHRDWCELDEKAYGQSLGYKNIIEGTKNLAVLCRHDVDRDRQINTLTDISSFHVRAFDFAKNKIIETSVVFDNKWWQAFVLSWFKDSSATYNRAINSPRDNTEWLRQYND